MHGYKDRKRYRDTWIQGQKQIQGNMNTRIETNTGIPGYKDRNK